MGLNSWVHKTPALTLADYQQCFASDGAVFADGSGWYRGTGIAPAAHPLAGEIPFAGCEHCTSRNVLVIAAQRSIHPMSGDEYWDYELVCQICGRFTQRSYAEN